MARAATPPADASLTDGINEFVTRVQNYATEDAVREFPMTAIAHINGLIGIIRKQAAALRARPQVVAEGFVDAEMTASKRAISNPVRCSMMHAQGTTLVLRAGFVQRSLWLRNEYGQDEVPPEKILAQLDEVIAAAGELAAQVRGEVSP